MNERKKAFRYLQSDSGNDLTIPELNVTSGTHKRYLIRHFEGEGGTELSTLLALLMRLS